MSERVLIVPAEMVHAAAASRPFWRWDDAANEAFVARLNREGTFQPRSEVETDETRRQVIAYLLLRAADGRYFSYRRLPASGEERLVHLSSIGVGGHINDDGRIAGLTAATDALRPNLIADGMQRELAEELVLPSDGRVGSLRLHGFLALAETPVQRVHVGVVAILDVPAESVERWDIRERDVLEPTGWHCPEALAAMSREVAFEGWSGALIDAGLP